MKNVENASNQVMQIITGKWISKPLYVATKLNIPDFLVDESKSISEISEYCETHEPYLYRVMRALSSVGFFVEYENSVFGLTSMGECLTTGKMKPMVLFFLSEWHEKAWESLLYSVKTGKTAFDSAFNMPAFKWMEQNTNEGKIFNQANSIKSQTSHGAILEVYDFDQFDRVADIGGGYGDLMIKILEKNKQLKGFIADLSYSVNDTKEIIKEKRLSDRCDVIACDFFKEVPKGSDCYILSNILHDWNDEKSHLILENCYNTMDKGSKLLIIESIIPMGNEFSIAKLLDLEVLVMGGGKERTENEFRELINKSGFYLENVLDTKGNISILECVK